jgi:hypothetical protein
VQTALFASGSCGGAQALLSSGDAIAKHLNN